MLLILAAGIGICGFMLIQLWQKKEPMGQARYLALALQLLWMIRFGLLYAKLVDIASVSAPLVIYDQTLLFLDGPLIWLYTRSLIEPKKFRGLVWVHFLPFALIFAYSSWQLISFPESIVQLFQDTWQSFQDGSSSAGGLGIYIIAGILFSNLFYLWKSIKVARAFNAALEDEYSTTDRLNANWIIRFQKLWLLLFVVPLLLYFLNYVWPLVPMLTLAGSSLVAIVLLSVVFNSSLIRQVYVSLPHVRNAKVKKPVAAENQQTELDRLLMLLKTDKAYLEESLTLGELASSMEMKPAELTELIKGSTYDNFYDLINSHRIEEVKARLLDSDEQVMQIAYQSGFKSKSTFNKIFKEKTGLTPKAYRFSHK